MRVARERRADIAELLMSINAQLYLGHFDLWAQENLVMYRHALVLAGGVAPSNRQCEVMLKTALDACERYFPAFQFVVWAGNTAEDALDATVSDRTQDE